MQNNLGRNTGRGSEYLIPTDFPRPQLLLESASRPFPALLIFTLRALSAAVVVWRRLKR
jgi:hypothetical protein